MRALKIGLAILLVTAATAATAQTVPGPANQGRQCQTVRTCNFARGATVRGCLSAYTCRDCKLVKSDCTIYPGQGTCRRMVCTWGG